MPTFECDTSETSKYAKRSKLQSATHLNAEVSPNDRHTVDKAGLDTPYSGWEPAEKSPSRLSRIEIAQQLVLYYREAIAYLACVALLYMLLDCSMNETEGILFFCPSRSPTSNAIPCTIFKLILTPP